MSLWMPRKKPLYAPMLSTFGGGSVRGFRGSGGGGGLTAINAFLFIGRANAQAGLNKIRANLAAANSDLGYPTGTEIDVFGGGDALSEWDAATGNARTSRGTDAQMEPDYDCGMMGNGSGTNGYATSFVNYMWDRGKGAGLHMFATAEYQTSTSVFGGAYGMSSSIDISTSTAYTSQSYNISRDTSSLNLPFLNNIPTLMWGTSSYFPDGGLQTKNGSTGWGLNLSPDGSNYLGTAKNATGTKGRIIATSHPTYPQGGDATWTSDNTDYASLTSGAQGMLKHMVQVLYWLAGQGDDI